MVAAHDATANTKQATKAVQVIIFTFSFRRFFDLWHSTPRAGDGRNEACFIPHTQVRARAHAHTHTHTRRHLLSSSSLLCLHPALQCAVGSRRALMGEKLDRAVNPHAHAVNPHARRVSPPLRLPDACGSSPGPAYQLAECRRAAPRTVANGKCVTNTRIPPRHWPPGAPRPWKATPNTGC